MQQKLQEAFRPVMGLPLTRTTRNGQVQYFHFGSTHYTTSQGLVLDIGEYTLALNCPWHMRLPDGKSITHEQVFRQKEEAGLPDPKFDWKVPGSNLRDQRLKELLRGNMPLAAESLIPGEGAGFTLQFTYGATLSVTPDPASQEEVFWQVFSNKGDDFKVEAGPAGLKS